MSRDSGGTYTLPGGNPVVTGTVISSTWANTTFADVAAGLTDSLSRSGKGAMTAQLALASGVIGTPGLGFSAETNTGLYRAAAGDIRFSIAAADILKIAAASLTAPAFIPTSATVPSNGMYLSAANQVSFSSNSIERFRIQSTGALLINAPTSGRALDVSSTTTVDTARFGTISVGLNVGLTGSGENIYAPSTLVIGTTGAAVLALYTNSVQRIALGATGQTTIYDPTNGINALKNAATFEASSFTGTITGCTAANTGLVSYSRVGNTVTLDVAHANLSGTSNSTAFTITGLPASLQPARTQYCVCQVTDGGTAAFGGVYLAPGSGTMTFVKGAGNGGATFTNSATTKGLTLGFTVTYNLT